MEQSLRSQKSLTKQKIEVDFEGIQDNPLYDKLDPELRKELIEYDKN